MSERAIDREQLTPNGELTIDLLAGVTFHVDPVTGRILSSSLTIHPEPKYVADDRDGNCWEAWHTTSYVPLPDEPQLSETMRFAYEAVRRWLIEHEGRIFPESNTDPGNWPERDELQPNLPEGIALAFEQWSP